VRARNTLGNNCVAPANSSNCDLVSLDARGMGLRMHDLYPRPMPALRWKVTPALREPRLSGTALLHTKVASAIGPAARARAALKLPSFLELPLNLPLTVALEYTPLG
jgi:hypothetical protein